MDAVRAATALQMAILDHRNDDVDILISGLDDEVLRATVRVLVVSWREAVAYFVTRAELRDAVAADALDQAVMDDDDPGPSQPE